MRRDLSARRTVEPSTPSTPASAFAAHANFAGWGTPEIPQSGEGRDNMERSRSHSRNVPRLALEKMPGRQEQDVLGGYSSLGLPDDLVLDEGLSAARNYSSGNHLRKYRSENYGQETRTRKSRVSRGESGELAVTPEEERSMSGRGFRKAPSRRRVAQAAAMHRSASLQRAVSEALPTELLAEEQYSQGRLQVPRRLTSLKEDRHRKPRPRQKRAGLSRAYSEELGYGFEEQDVLYWQTGSGARGTKASRETIRRKKPVKQALTRATSTEPPARILSESQFPPSLGQEIVPANGGLQSPFAESGQHEYFGEHNFSLRKSRSLQRMDSCPVEAHPGMPGGTVQRRTSGRPVTPLDIPVHPRRSPLSRAMSAEPTSLKEGGDLQYLLQEPRSMKPSKSRAQGGQLARAASMKDFHSHGEYPIFTDNPNIGERPKRRPPGLRGAPLQGPGELYGEVGDVLGEFPPPLQSRGSRNSQKSNSSQPGTRDPTGSMSSAGNSGSNEEGSCKLYNQFSRGGMSLHKEDSAHLYSEDVGLPLEPVLSHRNTFGEETDREDTNRQIMLQRLDTDMVHDMQIADKKGKDPYMKQSQTGAKSRMVHAMNKGEISFKTLVVEPSSQNGPQHHTGKAIPVSGMPQKPPRPHRPSTTTAPVINDSRKDVKKKPLSFWAIILHYLALIVAEYPMRSHRRWLRRMYQEGKLVKPVSTAHDDKLTPRDGEDIFSDAETVGSLFSPRRKRGYGNRYSSDEEYARTRYSRRTSFGGTALKRAERQRRIHRQADDITAEVELGRMPKRSPRPGGRPQHPPYSAAGPPSARGHYRIRTPRHIAMKSMEIVGDVLTALAPRAAKTNLSRLSWFSGFGSRHEDGAMTSRTIFNMRNLPQLRRRRSRLVRILDHFCNPIASLRRRHRKSPHKARLMAAIAKRTSGDFSGPWDMVTTELFIWGQWVFELFSPPKYSKRSVIFTIVFPFVLSVIFFFMAGEYPLWKERRGEPRIDYDFGPGEFWDWLIKRSVWRTFDSEFLVRWGGRFLPAAQGDPQRWFLSLLVHESFSHLASNVLLFLVLTWGLEGKYGFWRTSIVCLLSGIAGNFVSAIGEDPCALVVGASGCVFGLAGFYIIDVLIDFKHVIFPFLRLIGVVVFLVAFVIALATQQDTSHLSHTGGFLAGCGLSVILIPRFIDERLESALIWVLLVTAGTMFAIFPAIVYYLILPDLVCGLEV